MPALTATVPDRVLALVEVAMAWDLGSSDLPAVEVALDLARQFTHYGRIVAEDLRTQCLGVPADSDIGRRARATRGEADRRFRLKPLAPSAAQRSAAKRAQSHARLLQALNHAMSQVSEELARPVSRPVGIAPGVGASDYPGEEHLPGVAF